MRELANKRPPSLPAAKGQEEIRQGRARGSAGTKATHDGRLRSKGGETKKKHLSFFYIPCSESVPRRMERLVERALQAVAAWLAADASGCRLAAACANLQWRGALLAAADGCAAPARSPGRAPSNHIVAWIAFA